MFQHTRPLRSSIPGGLEDDPLAHRFNLLVTTLAGIVALFIAGQFIENLAGERLTRRLHRYLRVCQPADADRIVSELRNLWAHPHVQVLLSFADTAYGPWLLERNGETQSPQAAEDLL